MNPAGSFTPPTQFNQDVGLGWEYVRISNSSPYQLQISLGGQGTKKQPEMFLEDIFLTQGFNGKVVITPVARMLAGSINNALTNYVELEVYGRGEIRTPVAQPITTLANVGNSLPLSATATAIANDGTVSDTEYIESSISGTKHWSGTTGGGLTLTQLPAVNFQINKTLAAASKIFSVWSATDKKTLQLTQDTNGTWHFFDQTDGVDLITMNNGGCTIDNNTILTNGAGALQVQSLQGATGGKLKGISQFNGTGTTVGAAHGLGTTPTAVFINSNGTAADTFKWGNAGATTVDITEGSMSSVTWVAIAVAF